jgi:hypothetical protein
MIGGLFKMCVTQKRLPLVLLFSLALLTMIEQGLGQDWSGETTAATSEWHQKVLRHPQSSAVAQSTSTAQPSEDTQAAVFQTSQTSSAGQVQPTSYNQYQPSYSTRRNSGSAIATSPRNVGRQRVVRVSDEEEVVPPGEIQYEPIAKEGVYAEKTGCGCGDGGDCDTCGECGDCGSCGGCGPKQDAYGYECFDGHIDCWWIRDLTVLAGAQGFKGPRDRNGQGNFGLHEGIEMSGPLGDPWNIGYQIGANFEQSNFSSTSTTSLVDRKQYFVTASMFRRAECTGFQWAVAYDYLSDNYDESVDLQQIRSETSFLFNNVNEIGYFGVYGVSSARLKSGIRVEPTDMFALFLRRYFENGGDGRIWGGATAYGDGLLGVDLWVPLGKSFALENSLSYVIPKQGTGDIAQNREAWGLTMSLIWYPGRSATCQQHNPYRPMLRTADNTMFMLDRNHK